MRAAGDGGALPRAVARRAGGVRRRVQGTNGVNTNIKPKTGGNNGDNQKAAEVLDPLANALGSIAVTGANIHQNAFVLTADNQQRMDPVNDGGSAVEIKYYDFNDAANNPSKGDIDNANDVDDKFVVFGDGGFNYSPFDRLTVGNLKVLVREVKNGVTYSSDPKSKGSISRFEILGGGSTNAGTEDAVGGTGIGAKFTLAKTVDPDSLTEKVPKRTLHVGTDAVFSQLAAVTFSSDKLIAGESDLTRGPHNGSNAGGWTFLNESNQTSTVLAKVSGTGGEFGKLNITPKNAVESGFTTFKVKRTNATAAGKTILGADALRPNVGSWERTLQRKTVQQVDKDSFFIAPSTYTVTLTSSLSNSDWKSLVLHQDIEDATSSIGNPKKMTFSESPNVNTLKLKPKDNYVFSNGDKIDIGGDYADDEDPEYD